MDQKEIDDYNAAKKAADEHDAKTSVTEADIKSLDEKLLAFATGLNAGERKHLFSILDKGTEGGDVQGFWWHDTWRIRWWHGPWGWRWWRRY